MTIHPHKVLAVSAAFVLLSATACAPAEKQAPTAARSGKTIEWGSCQELVDQLQEYSELTESPSVLAGWEDRLQCGELSVPVDYADPDGRQLTIKVSRMEPKGDSKGVILTNPGGPGIEGRTLPAWLASSAMGELLEDRTLVGVDVRGTGGSTAVECTEMFDFEAPEGDVTVEMAADYSASLAAANTSCAASDPTYFANLTSQNVARDLDRVRVALDVPRIDYFGTSWGTELGAHYLALFPDHVDRMLLDSVADLRGRADESLDDLGAAEVAFGADSGDASGGLSAPMGYNPLSMTTRTALTCNAYVGAVDPQHQWESHVARAARLGLDVQNRSMHPLSGDLPGTSVCAGWPYAAQPFDAGDGGDHDNLQIVVHEQETVTPAVWGQHAHDMLGGSLYTLHDAMHGSLVMSDAAPAAVEFLRTGTPMG